MKLKQQTVQSVIKWIFCLIKWQLLHDRFDELCIRLTLMIIFTSI